jgi:hypothetical protein
MSGKSSSQAATLDQDMKKGGDGAVDGSVQPCPKAQRPKLLVKVSCDVDDPKTICANVNAVGQKASKAKTGIADFGAVSPGTYTVSVAAILAPDDKDYVILPAATSTVTLAQGDSKTVELKVDKKNIVKPKLELEYKVVMLDRGLGDLQDASQPKLLPDPTYVELSFTESSKTYPYPGGGKFSCTPDNVKVYLDAACTQELTADLTAQQLAADTKLKLYLRGKTAGKFSAKLELTDPSLPGVRVDEAAVEGMGVVELEMVLHQHERAKLLNLKGKPDDADALNKLKLPKPAAMADAAKVTKMGRLLHEQDNGNFSRAKLLIKKYTKKHWPDGTDDYQIVLTQTATTGTLAIHGKEWDDDPKNPVKITVADLKAKEHEFWVEGGSATSALLDVKLDLGMDRADGGLAKTPKRHGDWAGFTVVKIDEVKVDYQAPATGAAWDDTEKRFHINLLAGTEGRKVTIGAKLSVALADVDLHLMLAPDKDNRKKANWNVDMPKSWDWKKISADLKHLDKQDYKKYLHLSAKTDAAGYAKVEVILSRFGGDKFHPAAYIDQDPHLAKYVDGHAELAKRKPVTAKDDSITVWRKVWYQLTKDAGFTPPVADATEKAYEEVYTELELANTFDFDAGSAPARTYYPEYMLKPGSSSTAGVANIGSYNKDDVAALLVTQTDQPVKRHLMVCAYQCDPKDPVTGKSEPIETDMSGQAIDIYVGSNLYVVEPEMENGGSMAVSVYWYRDSDKTQQPLAANAATVPIPRKKRGHIQVTLPAIVPPPSPDDAVYVVARCNTAKGFLGESFSVRHTLAVYDPTDNDDYFDTITHEFGHSFNQTPRPGKQPDSLPKHPKQKDRGQGNHCQLNDGKEGKKTKYLCVMYDAGPMKWGIHKFCPKCQPYVLAEDFHKP